MMNSINLHTSNINSRLLRGLEYDYPAIVILLY